MARKLVVEVVGDTSNLQRAFRRGRGEAEGFGRSLGQLRVGFAQLAKATIVVDAVQKAMEALNETIHLGIEEVSERAKIQAQVTAALKSTGDVAHTSSAQIDEMALALSNLSGIDDEVIKSGEATLLTFTKVRNYAGANNQIFDRATKVIVDMAAKTGRAMPQLAVAVGRALQDPAKAVGALRRAQVALTTDEQYAIKTALAHGNTLKAQKLILDDLNKRYGGQAKALGQTLPGMLNILKARFKDLAGDLDQRAAPAVKRVTDSMTRFAKDPSLANLGGVFRQIGREAGRALAGLSGAIGGALHGLADRIRDTDFRAAGRRAGHAVLHALRGALHDLGPLASGVADVGRAVGERLSRVNWGQAIRRAAQALSRGIARLADYLREGIQRVNWNQVGKYIVDGIVVAVAAVVQFLRSVDWGRVARAIWRLLIAAIKAADQLLTGIGEEIARLLLKGLELGLEAIGRYLERAAVKIELKIVEPFSHLPKKLGGGFFQDLKAGLQQRLADLEKSGHRGGVAVGQAIQQGVADGVTPGRGGFRRPGDTRAGAADPRDLPTYHPGPPAPAVAQRRNQWFDARIDRMISRSQYDGLRQQLSVLQQVATLIRHRIAVTRDITRRLNLEDKYLSVIAQQKEVRQQIVQKAIDALQFNVDKAGLTATLSDDLAALLKVRDFLIKRIKVTKDNLALRQQLLGYEQQIADIQKQQAANRAAAREAAQFRLLGLGPTGEALIPGVHRLRRNLDAVREAIRGTFLDTRKEQGLLGNISEILSGQLGKVGRDVRSKIAEILVNIRQQLKAHAVDITAFQKTSVNAFLAATGLHLTPAQRRRLALGLSAIGPRGLVPAPSGQFTQTTYHIQELHVHGVQHPKQLENELTKRHKQRPHTRRGHR